MLIESHSRHYLPPPHLPQPATSPQPSTLLREHVTDDLVTRQPGGKKGSQVPLHKQGRMVAFFAPWLQAANIFSWSYKAGQGQYLNTWTSLSTPGGLTYSGTGSSLSSPNTVTQSWLPMSLQCQAQDVMFPEQPCSAAGSPYPPFLTMLGPSCGNR